MNELKSICDAHNLILIEDNAQAIGGNYNWDGNKTNNGLIGDIGTTSFFPSKNLGCYGDGGAVYSKHEVLYLKMKKMANHGQAKKYEYDEIGINSRLDSIQAAILNVKLKKLDHYIGKRREAANIYDQVFQNSPGIEIPKRCEDSFHVFHQYTLKIDSKKRDIVREELSKKEIPSMIYYPKPLHLNKAYSEFGYKSGDFPVAEKLSESVISLPMHTELVSEQLDYICENFKNLVNSN
jgi:dTDP-4-amino-4,6-dideoxygalactose transaminase